MKRLAVAGLALALLLAGCARHVVAPRDAGRVDSARSITSYSDTQWTILRAPAQAEPAPAPPPAP